MQVSEADLLGGAIEQRCSKPRQMAMAMAREFTGASLAKIGGHFRRDHTTVLHAIRRVAAAENADPNFKAAMDKARSALRAQKPSSPELKECGPTHRKSGLRGFRSTASNPRHDAAHGADGHRDKKNARGSDAASPRPGAFRHPLSPFSREPQP
jgi:hypothetical protein